MAFGIDRNELSLWKQDVRNGQIAFLTHYWTDDRFLDCYTVTKVGCSDKKKLVKWGKKYGLLKRWIDNHHQYPHFDLFGEKQIAILISEQKWQQLRKFKLINNLKHI